MPSRTGLSLLLAIGCAVERAPRTTECLSRAVALRSSAARCPSSCTSEVRVRRNGSVVLVDNDVSGRARTTGALSDRDACDDLDAHIQALNEPLAPRYGRCAPAVDLSSIDVWVGGVRSQLDTCDDGLVGPPEELVALSHWLGTLMGDVSRCEDTARFTPDQPCQIPR